jgi:hypothetical protein
VSKLSYKKLDLPEGDKRDIWIKTENVQSLGIQEVQTEEDNKMGIVDKGGKVKKDKVIRYNVVLVAGYPISAVFNLKEEAVKFVNSIMQA